jgi:hypothetical protein
MSPFLAWATCSVIVFALFFLVRTVFAHLRASNPKALPVTTYSVEEKTAETPPTKNEELPRSITQSNEDSIDRGEWVRRLTCHIYAQRHGSRYNVLTIHTRIAHEFTPEGVVERFFLTYTNSKTAQDIPYDVVVFRKGKLKRFGDGGYINWCFEGNFDRLDDVVTFNEI